MKFTILLAFFMFVTKITCEGEEAAVEMIPGNKFRLV